MHTTLPIFILVIIVALAGGWVSAGSMKSGWYQTLTKPAGNPPNWVFSVVWPILYLLIAVSTARVVNCPHRDCEIQQQIIYLFIIQLILNFAWTAVFFGSENPVGGLYILIALVLVAGSQMIRMFQIDTLSGLLFLPYILWLLYALYLNWSIVRLN